MPTDPTRWQWDRPTRRYRDTETGRFLSHETTVTLRDRYTEARKVGMRDLARTTLAPRTDPVGWNTTVRHFSEVGWRHAERTMIGEYTFGRGGANAMTAGDRATVQSMLRNQKDYWDRFMTEALDGRLSEDQIIDRATMYTDASTGFYERGREEAFNIRLPGHPGDGGTRCLTRCKCSWEIVERKAGVTATWQARGDNICEDCERRAAEWSALTFTREA
jgi:hypothetical protein